MLGMIPHEVQKYLNVAQGRDAGVERSRLRKFCRENREVFAAKNSILKNSNLDFRIIFASSRQSFPADPDHLNGGERYCSKRILIFLASSLDDPQHE